MWGDLVCSNINLMRIFQNLKFINHSARGDFGILTFYTFWVLWLITKIPLAQSNCQIVKCTQRLLTHLKISKFVAFYFAFRTMKCWNCKLKDYYLNFHWFDIIKHPSEHFQKIFKKCQKWIYQYFRTIFSYKRWIWKSLNNYSFVNILKNLSPRLRVYFS